MAKIRVPPNIAEDQFMFSGVTGIANGQNEKNQRGVKTRRAPMLMARPYLPRDQRRGGNGGP